MARRKQTTNKPIQIYDVVDEVIELPEAQAHLCSMHSDEDQNGHTGHGRMRFLLNREVMDVQRDIVDELEMSRSLPISPRDVTITDAVVVHILQKEDIGAMDAIDKAVAWYSRQKNQVFNDALFVAVTMYNDLHGIAVPYKSNEIAFAVLDDSEYDRQRKLPEWMKQRVQIQIPQPERRLSNVYEHRLKQLFDLTTACGAVWTAGFTRVFNEGLAKIIRLVEPQDDAGFQPESSA